jgi:hypothetical protein
MGAVDRRELVSNVCSQFSFLISNMGNSEVITSIKATPSKEYGAYMLGVALNGDSVSLTLKTKRTKRSVYSAFLKYGYIHSLGKFGWYIQSCPYKNGKKDRFLEVSLYVEDLDNSCFELLTQVLTTDKHLKALSELLGLWVEDVKEVLK